MAHKALIGGTAYEISGGKTLIDGTAYSIDKGKTFVDGTAYEVGFAKPMAIVTLEEDLPTNSSTSFEIIYYMDDIQSIQSAGSYEIPIGTTLYFEIRGSTSSGSNYVYINDEEVAFGEEEVSYNYTLTTNITVSYMNTPFGGYFYITEQ